MYYLCGFSLLLDRQCLTPVGANHIVFCSGCWESVNLIASVRCTGIIHGITLHKYDLLMAGCLVGFTLLSVEESTTGMDLGVADCTLHCDDQETGICIGIFLLACCCSFVRLLALSMVEPQCCGENAQHNDVGY